MDLNELKNNGKELTGEEINTDVSQEKTINEQSEEKQNDVNSENPIISDEKELIYEGPGIIVEQEESNNNKKGIHIPNVPSESMKNIMNRLNEMDEEIKSFEENNKVEVENDDNELNEDEDELIYEESDTVEENPEEIEKKYEESKIIIDKTGMGSIINFTDEEREKLEKSKVIKLEEIEKIELETLKIKKNKPKKGQIDKIIKKKLKTFSTPIVLPASGYTAVMSGCSSYELVSLMQNTQNPVLDTESKWSLIHSKIVETSIGKMDFNTFLMNTAAIDYNNFLYGIICATYPDEDKITLRCQNPKCKNEFEHFYDNKSLIRAEKISQKLQERIIRIVDNSYSIDMSRQVHETSPISMSKLVKLPDSELIVEFTIQSAYELIYKSMKELSDYKDSKYNQSSVLSSIIKRILILDDDGEYIEIDRPLDIVNVIYNLKDSDILVITKMGEELMEDLSLEFGFMNVKCPKCGTIETFINTELDYILFFKYQQAMSTRIE